MSGRAADVGLKGWGVVVVVDEPKNATTQEPGSLERRSNSFGLCCGVYATWAENTAEAPFFCPLLINACFDEASSLFLRWLM